MALCCSHGARLLRRARRVLLVVPSSSPPPADLGSLHRAQRPLQPSRQSRTSACSTRWRTTPCTAGSLRCPRSARSLMISSFAQVRLPDQHAHQVCPRTRARGRSHPRRRRQDGAVLFPSGRSHLFALAHRSSYRSSVPYTTPTSRTCRTRSPPPSRTTPPCSPRRYAAASSRPRWQPSRVARLQRAASRPSDKLFIISPTRCPAVLTLVVMTTRYLLFLLPRPSTPLIILPLPRHVPPDPLAPHSSSAVLRPRERTTTASALPNATSGSVQHDADPPRAA